jgi:hypothetical protein
VEKKEKRHQVRPPVIPNSANVILNEWCYMSRYSAHIRAASAYHWQHRVIASRARQREEPPSPIPSLTHQLVRASTIHCHNVSGKVNIIICLYAC